MEIAIIFEYAAQWGHKCRTATETGE
jgi:hypothetical protein